MFKTEAVKIENRSHKTEKKKLEMFILQKGKACLASALCSPSRDTAKDGVFVVKLCQDARALALPKK